VVEATPGTAFGTYADVATTIISSSQAAIAVMVDSLTALIPDPDTAPANRSTTVGIGGNFDLIAPVTAIQLRYELNTMSAAMAAAPV